MSPRTLHTLRTQMRRCQGSTEFSTSAYRIRWARRDYKWIACMTWSNIGREGIEDMYSSRRDVLLARWNRASI